jgi:hypothetical protein
VLSASAMAFEYEQIFASLEDRFDPLPDRHEVGAASGFIFAVWRMIVVSRLLPAERSSSWPA